MIVSAKGKLLSKFDLPTTVTKMWIPPRNISAELMLDKEICQAINHIHYIPSIIYTGFFIMIFPYLLHASKSRLEKI